MSEPSPGRIAEEGSVRRRHVFLIAGFDPKSERWYHALYRSQARRQAAVNGLPLSVGKTRRPTDGPGSLWTVRSEAGGSVETDIELLQWDDIVRQHWASSPMRVLRDGLGTVLWGLGDGAVQRMYRLYRPPVYAVFFPLVVLSVCALLAMLAGGALAALLEGAAGWPPPGAAAAGALAAWGLAWGALRGVHRIQITWLLRLVHFTHRHATGRVPGIDERLARFAQRIHTVVAAAAHDEVLVVGHSVGATLAMHVLAQALARDATLGRDRPQADGRPARFAFLSLGHCIPLLSALSPAALLRADLQRVAQSPIPWLDVTAPIDWAAFPGVDPVTGAGLPPAPAGWHPRLVSPRFHQLFGTAGYARLKRNRFQVHLQYLMASEHAGTYDFFAITAGPQSLGERWPGPGATPASSAP